MMHCQWGSFVRRMYYDGDFLGLAFCFYTLNSVSVGSFQVTCTNCSKVSSQYENMMDLTVEIHGNATSLEECLQQFTDKEWLHGDNMYRCDG